MSKVLVEISARHVHVTQQDLETLFGAGFELTVKKELSQPGEFASGQKVDIVGPKRVLQGVSILGPVRKATQAEISLTDARSIGVEVPVRESGDIAGSAGCTLVGPSGSVELKEGLIAAKRHVHLDTKTAEAFGLENKQVVGVKIDTPDRPLTFDNVVVRVNDSYAPAMHLDTDEGNAAGIVGECYGEIIAQ